MDWAARPNIIPWPPILVAAAVLAAWALGLLFPIPIAGARGVRIFGGAVVLLGLALDLSAMLVMHRARTNILPHRGADSLIVSGPFRFSRNPIYLGNTLVLAGAGVLFSNLWFVIFGLLAALGVDRLAIRREEQHLQAKFGAQWRAYADRTPRWLLRTKSKTD